MRKQFPIIFDTIHNETLFQASCHFDRRNIITLNVEREELGALLDITIDIGELSASVSLERNQAIVLKDWLQATLDNAPKM